MPPKLTAVAPVKLAPVITTEVPLTPEMGLNELIVGVVWPKVKLVVDVTVPLGVTIEIIPLVPLPTTAVIQVGFTEKL